MSRSIVTSFLVGAAALAVVTSGIAATPATTSLVVTPTSVHHGHVVAIHGNAGDCLAGDAVTIISRAFAKTHEFAGVPAVFAKVAANHRFATSTRIPGTKHAAHYNVTARCGGGNLGVIAHLVVLA
jgi:hypothetical protein